jgi:hypothetical protein
VQRTTTTLPEWSAQLQDATYASFIQVAGADDDEGNLDLNCSNTALRIRSNGSFVIYADYLEGRSKGENYEPGVIEGNWDIGQDNRSLQFFGKKYRVPVSEESGYLALSKKIAGLPGPRIFRSQVKVARFNDLPEAEQRNVLAFLVDRRLQKGSSEEDGKADTDIILNLREEKPQDELNEMRIRRKDLPSALAALLDTAKRLNPIFIKPDVYTDLLLPQEKVKKCRL